MPTLLGDPRASLDRATSVTLESLAELELLEALSVLDLLDVDEQIEDDDKQGS